MTDTEDPKLVESQTFFEHFAADAVGFAVINGTVAITLVSPRWDHSKTPNDITHVAVGRIILPVAGAQSLAVGLFDFLKKQGLDPAAPIKGDDTVQ